MLYQIGFTYFFGGPASSKQQTASRGATCGPDVSISSATVRTVPKLGGWVPLRNTIKRRSAWAPKSLLAPVSGHFTAQNGPIIFVTRSDFPGPSGLAADCPPHPSPRQMDSFILFALLRFRCDRDIRRGECRRAPRTTEIGPTLQITQTTQTRNLGHSRVHKLTSEWFMPRLLFCSLEGGPRPRQSRPTIHHMLFLVQNVCSEACECVQAQNSKPALAPTHVLNGVDTRTKHPFGLDTGGGRYAGTPPTWTGRCQRLAVTLNHAQARWTHCVCATL